jgi:hypothetical protein
MSRDRVGLDLGGLSDLSDFKPKEQAAPAPTKKEIEQASSFPSRERRGGRRRTGRTEQINIKARPDVIEQLYRISEQERMVLGEVLEHALTAFERELEQKG